MHTSEEINEIAKAVSSLQGNMKPALKDSTNPHFKAKFSSIAAIWEAIRDLLLLHGLCVLQDALTTEHGIAIITRIIHTSGQWLEFGPLDIPLTKKDAQGLGSAISYGKRYALSAALGIVSSDEDDDGNAAVSHPKVEAKAVQVQLINPEQIGQINDLITQNEEVHNWFFAKLKAGGMKTIADVSVQMFPSIINRLNAKLKEVKIAKEMLEMMDGS